jgi:hypothetical protein
MKPIHEMLREKQLELARLQKEVEALRLVAGMISEESKTELAVPEVAALPLAQEIAPPRPATVPAAVTQPRPVAPAPAVAPHAPLSVPAPLSPAPMIMRPSPPAYGEGALASANDALAKRFP